MSKTAGGRLLYVRSHPNVQIDEALESAGYVAHCYDDALIARAHIFNEPPDLILLSNLAVGWREFIQTLKADLVFGHLPIIVIMDDDDPATLRSILDLPLDDFVRAPDQIEELILRLQIRRSYGIRDLDANPLTRLPGNFTIFSAIQMQIENRRPFALCYADLDNFKAYNDRYGFARGDEALRMTARVLTNAVKKGGQSENFIGHIGGDDFIFIIPPESIDEYCGEIIRHFDMVAPNLFDDEDKKRGWFESSDRRNCPQRFPLLSISIAVIDSTVTRIRHNGEAAAVAGELKKIVKSREGSNYMVDRRSHAEAEWRPGAAPSRLEAVK